MSKITIGASTLTNTIYAGRLNKAGNQWVGEKFDVTDEAINAVLQYIYQRAIDNSNEYEECGFSNFKGYELRIYAKKVNGLQND